MQIWFVQRNCHCFYEGFAGYKQWLGKLIFFRLLFGILAAFRSHWVLIFFIAPSSFLRVQVWHHRQLLLIIKVESASSLISLYLSFSHFTFGPHLSRFRLSSSWLKTIFFSLFCFSQFFFCFWKRWLVLKNKFKQIKFEPMDTQQGFFTI